MRMFVCMTMLLAIAFTQPLKAEISQDKKIPKELHGSWTLDADASVKNAKASPQWKPEDDEKFTETLTFLSSINFTFSEDKLKMQASDYSDQADVELLSGKNGEYMIQMTIKDDVQVVKVLLRKDGKLNMISQQNKDDLANYSIWVKASKSGSDSQKGDHISVTSGQTIAFLGDSITAAGAKTGGYCQLVLDGLKKQGIDAKGVFAGISGHKSNQMLARLDKDVISKKPDWMTLSCGVNDVWHGARGVKLEDYKKNITQIVDKAQAAGIKVMILTSTMIGEDQLNANNQNLMAYNDFLRKLAKQKGCLLADLNKDMQEELKKFPKDAPKGKQLTGDGVHMNPLGNYMMAKGILKAFGVSESKLPGLVEDWKKIPGSKTLRFRLAVSMSQYEYEQLQKKFDKPIEQIFQDLLDKKKEELLSK